MIQKLIEFSIFVCLQSVMINGIFESFKPGMILNILAPDFFERNKNKLWAKPFYSCLRCMASVYGTISFFGFVPSVYGFHWVEMPLWVADVFILVAINNYFFKKL